MSGPWEAYSDAPSKPWEAYGGSVDEQTASKWDAANAAAKALQFLSPLGLITGVANYGMQKGNELLGNAAYNIGGSATDLAAKTGMPPEAAAGVGFAANVATQVAPAFLTGSAIGNVAAPAMQAAGRNMMRSALKPTVQMMQTGKGQKAVQTMLDEGVNVTGPGFFGPGGISKLQTKATGLSDQADNIISQSTGMVDKYDVASHVADTIKRFDVQTNKTADLAKINSVVDEFLKSYPDKIPVALANELKKGNYAMLGEKAYGKELNAAEEAAIKALTRGLRIEIEKQAPNVAAVNSKLGELVNAIKIASRREFVAGNKNPAGLALLPHSPLAGAAFLADRSELIKSLLARMMYSGSERIPQAVGGIGMAGAEGILSEVQRNKLGVLDQGN